MPTPSRTYESKRKALGKVDIGDRCSAIPYQQLSARLVALEEWMESLKVSQDQIQAKNAHNVEFPGSSETLEMKLVLLADHANAAVKELQASASLSD